MSDLLKKHKARKIRKDSGVTYMNEETGDLSSTPLYEGQPQSTHLMVDDILGNTSGVYHVWPSIAPSEEGGYKHQTDQEAFDKGEMFTFKNKKKAQKFAMGSWKKGKYK
jgi:hypothetical protein